MVAKLKRAASLPRMKDGRRPPMPMHAEGVSEGERVTPHSTDPDVERRRAAHALGHEPDTETEGESGTVSEPMRSVGMGFAYGRTDSMHTVRPSDHHQKPKPENGGGSGSGSGLQRSATTGGKIESQSMLRFPTEEDGEDDRPGQEQTVSHLEPGLETAPTPTAPPASSPRKRTRSRSRSRSLERKKIAQQLKLQQEEDAQMSSSTDDQVPPVPLPGPDTIGVYSSLGYMSPTMPGALPYTPSRAQSPTQFDGFAAAAAARKAARTPPPLALLQQIQARSRSPTPNLLGSPIFQMPPLPLSPTSPALPASGLPTLDNIRDRLGDRLGANLFRSNSAAARILQQGGVVGAEEHQIPLPPSRVNTPAAMSSRAGTPGPGLGRSNTTGNLMGMGMSPGGAGIGDRNAARQALFKKIGGRVENNRGGGGDGDQTSGAEDTVLMNGRSTPFRTGTPGAGMGGMRSPTPGGGRVQTPTPRAQTPGGVDDGGTSSVPGTPTPGRSRRRSHGRRKSRSSGVVPVVDDREEMTQTVVPPEPVPTPKPEPVIPYSPKAPVVNEHDDDDDDDDDPTGAKGLARQRSVKLERDKALQKLAGGPPSRLAHRPPLVEEDEDDAAETNTPVYLGLPTPLSSSTPQPRVPHSSDISVQSGSSIPVFVAEQGTMSPYKQDAFPVTISQSYPKAQDVDDSEDHEGERVVYPEDPSTKARRTFNESLDRLGGSKADLSSGSEIYRLPTELEQDDDENEEETDREIQTFQPYQANRRMPTASWVSRQSAEDVSSPQAEMSTFPASTPSAALFSGSARPDGDLHGSSASLASHGLAATSTSSTSHSSQGQPTGASISAHSSTDWEEVPVPKQVAKKEGARGWQQKVMTGIATLGRSASRTEGRRSRSNSIVNGRRDDGNRESASSAASTGATVSPTGSHHTIGQMAHAGASAMSLSAMPMTRGGVSPVPPALSNDPRLADGKLHAFPGIQKLEAERERKLRERGQSVSGINAESPERAADASTPSPEREVERRLHHQASDSRLLSRFQQTGVVPPKQEYVDIRVDPSTPNKGLPTTRDGVKKWLKVFQPASNGKPARNRKASLTDVLIHRGKGSDSGTERDDARKNRHKAHPPMERSQSGSDGARMELTADPFASTEVTPSPASTHSPSFVSPVTSPRNSRPVKNVLRASFVMAQVDALLAGDASKPVQLDDPPRKLLLMSPALQVMNQNTVKDRYLILFTDLLVIAKAITTEDDTPRDMRKQPLDHTFVVRSVIELHKLHLHSIRDENASLTSSGDAEPQPAMKLFAQKFARDSIHAVTALQEKAKLQNEPATVAQLLFQGTELDKVQLGIFLAHRNSKTILRHFIDRFGFTNIRIDHALRIFLLSIVLPSDSSSVDYLLATFATRWFEANSGVIAFDKDLAIRLVLAIMHLNSALHSGYDAQFSFPNRAISSQDFIDAFRTRDVRNLVPDDVLKRIYESVRHQRIDQALDPNEGTPTKTVVITPGRLPERLTCRVASEPITIRIPEPDPDFTIRLYGQDLSFEPNVLDFSESNEQTFKVVGNSFGTKTMIMARTGRNAPLYVGIPLSNKFSVERAFMRNTFQISFVRHNEQARKYMFSVEGSLVHQQWMNVMRRQITRAVEADASDSGLGPLEAKSRRAAEAVAVQVLRDTLIAPDDRVPHSHARVGSSLGAMLAYGGEGPVTGMHSIPLAKGAPRSGHDLVTICQQNSLLPLVLGFLHSKLPGTTAQADESEREVIPGPWGVPNGGSA
ncbi:Sec7 guanine nucleotide exchange factor [Ceratobasidium sp. AG-Ba]|nr:Sec7 guanine nucleotide exchange factor [Ceratobasidium sp. AG-Ba]